MTLVFRRLLLGLPSLALALGVAWASFGLLAQGERHALDWVLGVLFVIVMAWESLVVVQVTLGFMQWWRGTAGLSALEARAETVEPVATGRSRTALVIPVFDEDVAAVFDGIAVMRRSLARLGRTDDIDIHVLSDSRIDAVADAEAESARATRGTEGPAVFHRRRHDNEGRKAGNIAEFLHRTRGTYDFMVVLDADSLMSGRAIRTLIRLMEESPRVALIQTISYAAGRTTLFARVQQFAVRLHAPLSLKSMAFWQGADGLYYGHNAIIRCEPFIEHAKLPVLPGKPPLGGEILCHDVVEAALLRRAGWEVRVLPDLGGTWEEMPTNVMDLLGRERRWCQGNLQHIRVLGMPGLTGGSRFHIAMGIGGYVVGPLWWSFVALGAVRVLGWPDNGALGVLAYGATETGPFARALLALGAFFLLWPRSLNVAHAVFDRRERAAAGGTGRLLASVAAEQVFAMLLTPLLSVITMRFVLGTFAGRTVQWVSQSRADRDVGWAEAASVLKVNSAAGLCLAAAAFVGGPIYAVWMLPTIAGLLAGAPLIVWSSRLGTGALSRRLGLFLTSDETNPAPELRDLQARGAAREAGNPVPATGTGGPALARLAD